MKRLFIKIIFILLFSIFIYGNSVYAVEENLESKTDNEIIHVEEIQTKINESFEPIENFELLGYLMVANDEANIRVGPDTKYKRIGKLKLGEEVFVVGKLSVNWYQIQYETQPAYVFCEYLSVIPKTEEITQETKEENMTGQSVSVQEMKEEKRQEIQSEQEVREELKGKEAAEEYQELSEKQSDTNYFPIILAILLIFLFISSLLFLFIGNHDADINEII